MWIIDSTGSYTLSAFNTFLYDKINMRTPSSFINVPKNSKLACWTDLKQVFTKASHRHASFELGSRFDCWQLGRRKNFPNCYSATAHSAQPKKLSSTAGRRRGGDQPKRMYVWHELLMLAHGLRSPDFLTRPTSQGTKKKLVVSLLRKIKGFQKDLRRSWLIAFFFFAWEQSRDRQSWLDF